MQTLTETGEDEGKMGRKHSDQIIKESESTDWMKTIFALGSDIPEFLMSYNGSRFQFLSPPCLGQS